MLHLLLNRAAGDDTFYDYSPSLAAGIAFVVLFSILTIAHLGLALKSRIWWTIVVAIGGVGEILGWAGRLWSAKNPSAHTAFLIQIVDLIIAPCFFSAMLYGTTGMLIRVIGPEFSLLGPAWFLRIFCTVDLISIVIQAAGGAMAGSDNPATSQNGTHTMVSGIVFQLAAMIVYSAITLHFYLRARAARRGRPVDSAAVCGVDALAVRRVKVLSGSIALASLAIIIRGIYRTAELAEGWNGTAISTEWLTFVLDAVPMVFCMIFLFPAHPYLGLPNRGRLVQADATPFADDATMTELGGNGMHKSKQSA